MITFYYCFSVSTWEASDDSDIVRYKADGSSSFVSYLRRFIDEYKLFIGPNDDIHMYVEIVDD